MNRTRSGKKYRQSQDVDKTENQCKKRQDLGRRYSDKTKKYPLRNGNGERLSSQTNISRQEQKTYFSKPEPKGWINSVKTNSIKVYSTVPSVKYYGDNTYGEYKMVNPHKKFQYENTCISPGSYQHKGNGTDSVDRGYNCGHGINHFGYYGDNLYQYGSNGIYNSVGYNGNQCPWGL